MAKLINDVYDFGHATFLTESVEKTGVNGKKSPPMYTISGIACVADQVNGNGRSYPYELLKEEVERINEEQVKPGRLLASLEHPDYPEIRPEDACAKILSVQEDNGKTWIAKSCILASQPEYGLRGTPKGDLLLSLVQYGTPVGYSTRALGELNEDETRVTDLKLMNFDIVLNPSIGIFSDTNGNRFRNGILESKQFVCDFHPLCEEKFDKFAKRVSKLPQHKMSSREIDQLGSAITEFFQSLTK